MRYRPRLDTNHHEIVAALEKYGATVQSIAMLGDGAPDLLVGWRGRNFLFEVKDRMKKPSERNLNEDEVRWHQLWRGQVHVVDSVQSAIGLLVFLESR